MANSTPHGQRCPLLPVFPLGTGEQDSALSPKEPFNTKRLPMCLPSSFPCTDIPPGQGGGYFAPWFSKPLIL